MMALIYWSSDGAGGSGGKIARVLNRWIRTKGNPALIVYGGDVYGSGTSEEFDRFFEQFGSDVSLVCETAGNHDWKTTAAASQTGRIPSGYEAFWRATTPSKQPIDTTKKGGARYEHFIDLAGWRLIFLDTGPCKDDKPWPFGDTSRTAWLNRVLTEVPGRSKIVFAHHSRLSTGIHGNNLGVDAIWKSLFDPTGTPLAALTLAGHDHNVSVYGPRSQQNPEGPSVPLAQGIHLLVNGAGGDTLYNADEGTPPDVTFEFESFCVTRIDLIDARSADVDVLTFGASPEDTTEPRVLPNSKLVLRF
jgi:Calcineurin-like phosphoesterase